MNTVFERAIMVADSRRGRSVDRVERAAVSHATRFCAKGK